MKLAQAYARLNIVADILPHTAKNRPGGHLEAPLFVCIHNTQNSAPGADAFAHARYMKGSDARRRKVSWHYSADDRRVVKHLPAMERAWHAGAAKGNNQAIAIEICEHAGIDQEEANDRAALLAAVLCLSYSIPVENVVPHKYFSNKFCPALILNSPEGFDGFRALVSKHLAALKEG